MTVAFPAQFFEPLSGPREPAVIDFSRPLGEAALSAPDSVSWQVFKNPVALFIGGVAAVVLELAEPRVRSGVWDHTSFRTDPLPRLQRTGMAAMVTVYGARSAAEALIAGVGRMHARVQGLTTTGQAYSARDPELLNWVQATAAFGFLEAYHVYVRPLSPDERDHFYAEGRPAAELYGARGAPASEAALDALFQAMRPKLEGSPVIQEFLEIMARTPALPTPMRPLQGLLIRAAVAITPAWARETLGLRGARALRAWEVRLVRALGGLADRVVLKSAPPAQACVRMGLPADYLYRRPRELAARSNS